MQLLRFSRAVLASAVLGLSAASLCAAPTPPPAAPSVFSRGDLVRATRGETLMFKNEGFQGAAKGQEFTVLKLDAMAKILYVSYMKDDGSMVAVSLPADAVEPLPQNAWNDLSQGAEAFRDQRFEDAKRLLARAALAPEYRSIAPAVATRVSGVLAVARQAETVRLPATRQALINAVQNLRDGSEQLARLGYPSLSLALEEGVDKLAAPILGAALPPTRGDREALSKRAAISNRAVIRCRQAIGNRKLIEASRLIEEGLAAEPARPELKAFQPKVQRGIDDSNDDFKAADSFRTKLGGVVHALSALQDGLKRCSDHPKLLALRNEMSEVFEERTSPPVTAAFLKTAGVAETASKALSDGHKAYTNRCTECHELETLDSRSASGWQKIVASMSRRARIDDRVQGQILEYIAAAQTVLEKTKKD